MARDALLAMTMIEVFVTARRSKPRRGSPLTVGAAKDHSHHFLCALGTGSPQFLGNLVMTFIVEHSSLRGDRSPDVAVQSLQVQIAYGKSLD